jgi:hypothetical protein
VSDDDLVACNDCYLCHQGDCPDCDRYDGCEFGIKEEDEETES